MTDTDAFEHIAYDVADHVATITLNRPDKLNAFTATMALEMLAAFDVIDADDDVRAVIVTGAGRGFCAGADLSGGGDTFSYAEGQEAEHRDGGGLVTLRIFECLKPVIGAINGPSVGIGTTMQLPMDMRLASTEARFGFVFARRGIVPEAASSWFLPRIVGISRALEWCETGRIFGADEALAGGLVRSVHEPDDLLPAFEGLRPALERLVRARPLERTTAAEAPDAGAGALARARRRAATPEREPSELCSLASLACASSPSSPTRRAAFRYARRRRDLRSAIASQRCEAPLRAEPYRARRTGADPPSRGG